MNLARRLTAEFIGSALLAALVIGSGIAAQRLSPTDTGLQLLENAFATALGLPVLILIFAPVSGAHFNPIVSLVDSLSGMRAWRDTSRNRRRGNPPEHHAIGIHGNEAAVLQPAAVECIPRWRVGLERRVAGRDALREDPRHCRPVRRLERTKSGANHAHIQSLRPVGVLHSSSAKMIALSNCRFVELCRIGELEAAMAPKPRQEHQSFDLPFWTIEQAALHLGFTRATINRYIREGLPVYFKSVRPMVKPQELIDEWLRRRKANLATRSTEDPA